VTELETSLYLNGTSCDDVLGSLLSDFEVVLAQFADGIALGGVEFGFAVQVDSSIANSILQLLR